MTEDNEWWGDDGNLGTPIGEITNAEVSKERLAQEIEKALQRFKGQSLSSITKDELTATLVETLDNIRGELCATCKGYGGGTPEVTQSEQTSRVDIKIGATCPECGRVNERILREALRQYIDHEQAKP